MKKLFSHVTFDHTNHPPIIVHSDYYKGNDGQLHHFIDDKLRAIVPPEGWAQYAKDWPEAQKAIDQLATRTEFAESVQTMLAASVAGLEDGATIIVPAETTEQDTQDVTEQETEVLEVTGTSQTEVVQEEK
jgi:hypothetical protein